MDVFGLRKQVIDEYRELSESFLDIRAGDIRLHVESQLRGQARWPAPRLGLNPNFALRRTVGELASEGLLDPRCEAIFRDRSGGGSSTTLPTSCSPTT